MASWSALGSASWLCSVFPSCGRWVGSKSAPDMLICRLGHSGSRQLDFFSWSESRVQREPGSTHSCKASAGSHPCMCHRPKSTTRLSSKSVCKVRTLLGSECGVSEDLLRSCPICRGVEHGNSSLPQRWITEPRHVQLGAESDAASCSWQRLLPRPLLHTGRGGFWSQCLCCVPQSAPAPCLLVGLSRRPWLFVNHFSWTLFQGYLNSEALPSFRQFLHGVRRGGKFPFKRPFQMWPSE